MSCNNRRSGKNDSGHTETQTPSEGISLSEKKQPVEVMLVVPENPEPGQPWRIVTVGGANILKAKLSIKGPSEDIKALKSKTSQESPYWRIDEFEGDAAGKYKASISVNEMEIGGIEFDISDTKKTISYTTVWKTLRGWDSKMETLYSAWVNALFNGFDEQSSWPALHKVTQDKNQNFLYNYFSLDEDSPDGKNSVIMQPDCADNPFFLRAYFAWKLGLPFGYHVCDRGYVGRNPGTGQWITNEMAIARNHPVYAFNAFLRKVMDGVHSGTARTALDNNNSDYYPVSLTRESLRPGTVYADPYGHTMVIISWKPQTNNKPGLLLATDAQPDGTVAIKRFWKGNFLFNTSEVVGEPGFKAFRPISVRDGVPYLVQNEALTESAEYIPFSLQQRKMESDIFYRTMERIINPEPLDPESELLSLIEALYEQLLVRVISVDNGEAYMKSHPGTIIQMPSGASGIFLAGGQWENFSTPNRDLRLLIAMDAVLDYPERVFGSPEDFSISGMGSPEQVREKLQSVLDKKTSELSINYTRSDGSLQKLTVSEILKRRDSFEMAYNPNDGIEIRWGAPENSPERATCRRQAPSYQLATMRSVRKWFTQRLHPPT